MIDSLNAEKIVIGALINGYKTDKILTELREENFQYPDLRQIFTVVKELIRDKQAVDYVNIGAKINCYSLVVEVGDITPGELTAVDSAIELLKELTTKRKLKRIAEDLNEMSTNGQTAKDTITWLKNQLDALIIKDRKVQKLSEVNYTNPGQEIESYEFKDFFNFVGGNLYIVAGRTSMGKTALLLHLAREIAKKHKVLFITLEMSFSELAKRLNITEDIELYVIDSYNYWDISSTIREQKFDIVFLDYLQRLGTKGENRNQELGFLARELKDLARTHNIPIVVASQLNRQVEYRADKQPKLADLRDSGEIEQEADIVLLLYRDDYYTNSELNESIMTVYVSKNRNGPTGEEKLWYDKARNYFTRYQITTAEDKV